MARSNDIASRAALCRGVSVGVEVKDEFGYLTNGVRWSLRLLFEVNGQGSKASVLPLDCALLR